MAGRSDGETFEDGLLHHDPDAPPPDRWTTRQGHLTHHVRLLEQELEDEAEQLRERQRHWPKARLQASGEVLFDVVGATNGWLFGDRILAFKSRDREPLPHHRFGQGDIVTICRKRPWDEEVIEGTVLDRNRYRLRIVVPDAPDGLTAGTWRIDRGANRVAHDRMVDALHRFDAVEGEPTAPLSELLLGDLLNIVDAAAHPPQVIRRDGRPWKGPPNEGDPFPHPLDRWRDELNPSQQAAIDAALRRRVSLIQGPPGTGKTHTAIRLLACWVDAGVGPILATADSNVAVDNLLEGLLALGIRAVRVGQPVKVREALREATLDARLEGHPLGDEMTFLRDHISDLQRQLPSLKGKERGLGHRDVNRGWKDLRAMEQRALDDILDSAEVVVATCIGAGHTLLADRRFPLVLIDEATQATEPATLVPIVRGAQRLVLVGDHHQLPPTVVSREALDRGLGRSLFERLVAIGIEPLLLDTQYRMHPTIAEFPGARFYDGRLTDGITAAERPAPAGLLWPDWAHPLAFVPVEGVEQVAGDGASRANLDEAAAVVDVVQALLDAMELDGQDIGVVTPYNGQVRRITDLMADAARGDDGAAISQVEVRSVDGYQGREKEVIVMSCVRANDDGQLGFVRDWRRLNVALTRARRGLVVVGHPRTLRHDSTWRAWLDWVEEKALVSYHLVP